MAGGWGMARIELLAANYNAGAMQVYADFRRWLARHDVKLTLRQCDTEEDLIHQLRSADVLLAFRIPVTRRVIAASPRLRLIMASGNGYDHIDVAAATEHGVPVTCGRRYNVQDVAEHAILLMLWCGRKIGLLQAGVRRNAWPWPCGAHVQPVSRLAGRTVGIVGFGLIGRAVAALARGLGLTVCAHDPYLPAERIEAEGAAPVSLTELLQRSDFVSLHLRANEETARLIGEPQLRMMRRTAYVINNQSRPGDRRTGAHPCLARGVDRRCRPRRARKRTAARRSPAAVDGKRVDHRTRGRVDGRVHRGMARGMAARSWPAISRESGRSTS